MDGYTTGGPIPNPGDEPRVFPFAGDVVDGVTFPMRPLYPDFGVRWFDIDLGVDTVASLYDEITGDSVTWTRAVSDPFLISRAVNRLTEAEAAQLRERFASRPPHRPYAVLDQSPRALTNRCPHRLPWGTCDTCRLADAILDQYEDDTNES